MEEKYLFHVDMLDLHTHCDPLHQTVLGSVLDGEARGLNATETTDDVRRTLGYLAALQNRAHDTATGHLVTAFSIDFTKHNIPISLFTRRLEGSTRFGRPRTYSRIAPRYRILIVSS